MNEACQCNSFTIDLVKRLHYHVNCFGLWKQPA